MFHVLQVREDKHNINVNYECDLSSEKGWEQGSRLLENDFSIIIGEKIRHMDGEEFWVIKYLI